MQDKCKILNGFVDRFLESIKTGTCNTKIRSKRSPIGFAAHMVNKSDCFGDNEASVTVYRDTNGKLELTAIQLGKKDTVKLPDAPRTSTAVASIHTHTSGDLNFSPMDYLIALTKNLEGQCVARKDGNRHCELLREIDERKREEIANEAIALFDPNLKNREDRYRELGNKIKKLVATSCEGK